MCSGRRLGTTGERIKGWRRLSHHGASPEVVRKQSRPLPILQYPRLLAYSACFDQDGNKFTTLPLRVRFYKPIKPGPARFVATYTETWAKSNYGGVPAVLTC